MNNEKVREIVSTLEHVEECVQWGHQLVFWAGDKAIGGKMFAMIDLDGSGQCVAIVAAGPEGMAELCEMDGVRPAPYLARAHWVCVERWDALTSAEWQQMLARAHEIVLAKLAPGTRKILAMEPKARSKAIRERKLKLKSGAKKK
jgi:predicted DNA-binding protein (MmcQ/YjbR family)